MTLLGDRDASSIHSKCRLIWSTIRRLSLLRAPAAALSSGIQGLYFVSRADLDDLLVPAHLLNSYS
jgi:hypothetical protein